MKQENSFLTVSVFLVEVLVCFLLFGGGKWL